MRVFLSYRRSDVSGYAGRLSDALIQQLGPQGVFQDVTAIAPGHDFKAAIDRALERCDAVLAVIGPGWLTAATPDGTLRLHQEIDYVRLELARALARDIPVVPVLVGGSELPSAADLPKDLHPLARRQAVVLRDGSWHRDVAALIARLRGGPEMKTVGRRRWMGGAAALLVAALGVALWGLWPEADGDEAVGQSACSSGDTGGWNELALSETPVREGTEGRGSFVFEVESARWRQVEPGLWQLMVETSMENRTREATYHGDWLYDGVIVGQRAFDLKCFSPDPEVVSPDTVGDALAGFDVRCEPGGHIELLLSETLGRIDVTSNALEPAAC